MRIDKYTTGESGFTFVPLDSLGRRANLAGRRFGKLTAVRLVGCLTNPMGHHGVGVWLCDCDCGNEIVVRATSLCATVGRKTGGTRSCGCRAAGEGLLDKVRRKVAVTASGCWEWQGHRLKGTYGLVWHRGKRVYVHRAVYEAVHGAITGGLLVCHECDNPPCCNPDHLFLGTHKDNSQDAVSKGRIRSGDRHQTAKINADLAAIIFKLRHVYGHSVVRIARFLRLNSMTVRDVVNRNTWRDATDGLAQKSEGRHEGSTASVLVGDAGDAGHGRHNGGE